jgi:hypothetical protein
MLLKNGNREWVAESLGRCITRALAGYTWRSWAAHLCYAFFMRTTNCLRLEPPEKLNDALARNKLRVPILARLESGATITAKGRLTASETLD